MNQTLTRGDLLGFGAFLRLLFLLLLLGGALARQIVAAEVRRNREDVVTNILQVCVIIAVKLLAVGAARNATKQRVFCDAVQRAFEFVGLVVGQPRERAPKTQRLPVHPSILGTKNIFIIHDRFIPKRFMIVFDLNRTLLGTSYVMAGNITMFDETKTWYVRVKQY